MKFTITKEDIKKIILTEKEKQERRKYREILENKINLLQNKIKEDENKIFKNKIFINILIEKYNIEFINS